MRTLFYVMLLSLSIPLHQSIATGHWKVKRDLQTPPAKNFIVISKKYDGSPGYIIYNWYGSNRNLTAAIRIVVRFSTVVPNNTWDQTIDLPAGTTRNIGNATYDGSHWTNVALVSANYTP